jgi:hypothetical protein
VASRTPTAGSASDGGAEAARQHGSVLDQRGRQLRQGLADVFTDLNDSGKRRAIVAVGNSVLTILWHMLSDPAATDHDPGPGFYESPISEQRRQHTLIR